MTRLAHFAINADDVDATRAFYEAVFGLRLEAWGPPDFFRVELGERQVVAALQARRELVPGTRTVGFEVTFDVDDVDAVAAAALAHGGKVLMEKTTIPGVGDLVWLEDPSGNPVGAMRYARVEPSQDS